jgi:hypothetical protein
MLLNRHARQTLRESSRGLEASRRRKRLLRLNGSSFNRLHPRNT